MEQQDDILQQTAAVIQDLISEPSRMLLFLGPVSFIFVLLLLILFFRLKNRRALSKQLREADTEQVTTQREITTEAESIPPRAPEAPAEEDIPAGPAEVAEIRNLDTRGWLQRLNEGLRKTRTQLSSNLMGLFSERTKLTPDLKDKLHEALFRSDLGVATSQKLVGYVEKDSQGEELNWDSVKAILKTRVAEMLALVQKPLAKPDAPPFVILVVGVNGVGKTTTVAKLAASFLAEDKSVLLCAADTFRAAAIDQLKVWGERLGIDVIAHQQGSDPAAVAYDGVKAAIARKSDVLIIDTAGRLHSKKELMDELGKINRVVGKDKPGAPHETLLVVDATTGQNALMQIKAFKEVVNLTGLIVTKLDGTAKGGVLVAAADQYGLPIHYIGVGEKAADLRPFIAEQYADSLL